MSPHGPTENIFEGFSAARMALPKIFLKGFWSSENGRKTIQNGPKPSENDPKPSENDPKPSETVRNSPKTVRNGPKPSETVRKRPKKTGLRGDRFSDLGFRNNKPPVINLGSQWLSCKMAVLFSKRNETNETKRNQRNETKRKKVLLTSAWPYRTHF